MDYIEGTVDMPYDTAESQDEAGAAHQMALDVLYRIGCQYNVQTQDMVTLCQLASIDFKELQNHSPNSTESTPCLSQSSFSVHQVQANQPACAT